MQQFMWRNSKKNMPKSVPKEVSLIKEYKVNKAEFKDENNISYSQFLSYNTCPHQWYLRYVRKLGIYEPSIHTVFGTAMHETIQTWLDKMYSETIKSAMEMDLNALLRERMTKTYKKEKFRAGHKHFSNPLEMESFYNDGVEILNYLKKKRPSYLKNKNTYLVGIETPLMFKLKSNLYFKGFIDLVLYDDLFKKYTILDIKTSTSGWGDYAKKDEKKTAQIVLYKSFFAEQFNVDPEDIEVKYIILKRKVPEEPEFASMGRRIQEFSPPSGKIKRGQVRKALSTFIEHCFDDNGNYQDKDYDKNACKSSCMFCEFKENKFLCNQGIF